jgi:hypothetical protein
MFISTQTRRLPATLALIALALVGLAFAGATHAAGAAKHHTSERLVVRGESTIKDTPCETGICLEFADGVFHGTSVGEGKYSGTGELRVAEAFPNGEGGVCAPIDSRIVLGAGTPDRLVLALSGDSCQDGAGPPPQSSFTTLARFVVKHGTGKYAKAKGSGVMSSFEDAADREQMTLIGRISG